ncbi:phosphotransferase family protein [Oceaniglobus ichthyenteri]|uniref:phosphotransferase family protein n=1 Tax=Oceaniglobus ichthyenteri TaxID=2136177 RepID=UPI000D358B92|nr:aminoglycoside phosphotransferase family protein [Oceaniglobus ichthyenteri]
MTHVCQNKPGLAGSLRQALITKGVIDRDARWYRMHGGRSNLVWRLVGRGAPLICKLSVADTATPMFPNHPMAERAALHGLANSGLVPDDVVFVDTPDGPCVIYRACAGAIWRRDTAAVGRILARLHAHAAPQELRMVSVSGAAILDHGDEMLEGLADDFDLPAVRPAAPHIPPGPDVFLHGDPVPGNIIMGADGPVLIDWQCPARGDAVHDLALFLSPAMQVLGRGAPLSPHERAAFLRAYGNPDVAERFLACEAALAWRMAAYCVWRIARGHDDYAPALAAELHHLKNMR